MEKLKTKRKTASKSKPSRKRSKPVMIAKGGVAQGGNGSRGKTKPA